MAISQAVVSGLFGLGSGLLNGGVNYFSQRKLNQQQADLQYQNQTNLMNESYKNQVDYLNKSTKLQDETNRNYQKDYASLIREGSEQAGFNPLVFLSQNGLASAGAVGQGQSNSGGSTGSFSSSSAPTSDIAGSAIAGAQLGANLEKQKAETDLIQAQTEKISGVDTKLTEAEVDKLRSDIDRNSVLNKLSNQQIQNLFEQDLQIQGGSLAQEIGTKPTMWSIANYIAKNAGRIAGGAVAGGVLSKLFNRFLQAPGVSSSNLQMKMSNPAFSKEMKNFLNFFKSADKSSYKSMSDLFNSFFSDFKLKQMFK